MYVPSHQVTKDVLGMTDEELNELPADSQEFLMELASILKETLGDQPRLLKKIQPRLQAVSKRFLKQLRNIEAD
jgi:hypothetical protein